MPVSQTRPFGYQVTDSDWNDLAALANSNEALLTAIQALIPPAGTIFEFGGVTVPTGWLECDGSAVSRTTYAALFAAIGTTWGVGDTTSTFNLPDLRGRSSIGAGTGGGLTARTLGQTLGEETHQLSTAELATHNHSATDSGHTHSITDPTHTHSITDPTHSHSITDPGHDHGVSDPGHGHLFREDAGGGSLGFIETNGFTVENSATSNGLDTAIHSNTTGLTVNSKGTGITAANAGSTGITGANAGSTGITGTNSGAASISVGNAGSNTAHNNMQPSSVVKKMIKY